MRTTGGLRRRDFIASGALLLAVPHTAARTDGSSDGGRRVLVVGDSLSAEYGLRRGSGWVALLERRLRDEYPDVDVVNASISGDTTAGGRARLAPLLTQHRPTHVVIELGGNDALRGLPLKQTEDNLRQMARQAREAGAQVLLLGIQVPPNYGRHYMQQFEAVFESVARAEQTDLVPFLLRGIADGEDPVKLFQADRIHPNEQAQPLMLDNVWPALRSQLMTNSSARSRS